MWSDQPNCTKNVIRSTELQPKWKINLRREGFKPTEYSKLICSVHFEDDWLDKGGDNVRLRGSTVSTKIDFPIDLQKSAIKRKPLLVQHLGVYLPQIVGNLEQNRCSQKCRTIPVVCRKLLKVKARWCFECIWQIQKETESVLKETFTVKNKSWQFDLGGSIN